MPVCEALHNSKISYYIQYERKLFCRTITLYIYINERNIFLAPLTTTLSTTTETPVVTGKFTLTNFHFHSWNKSASDRRTIVLKLNVKIDYTFDKLYRRFSFDSVSKEHSKAIK